MTAAAPHLSQSCKAAMVLLIEPSLQYTCILDRGSKQAIRTEPPNYRCTASLRNSMVPNAHGLPVKAHGGPIAFVDSHARQCSLKPDTFGRSNCYLIAWTVVLAAGKARNPGKTLRGYYYRLLNYAAVQRYSWILVT